MGLRGTGQAVALVTAWVAVATTVDLTTAAGVGAGHGQSAQRTVSGEGIAAARNAASWRAASSQAPRGQRRVFPHRILVAYYGAAHTGSLGVLGEAGPRVMTKRLRAAARPLGRPGSKVQIVYELIASVADASPGPDGDYSHPVPTRYVREYVRAARRNKALLVLDLQPGRSSFLSQARPLEWALRKPFVGLALDPEWRMGPRQVPARTVGSVTAAEVNRVSRYLSRLTRRHDLPQKVFVLHQFRADMIHHIERVESHEELATVQHVDGFGSQRQKRTTYHAVAKPKQFRMGLKLFYDEDTNLFRPREVLGIRPRVRFVSYQ